MSKRDQLKKDVDNEVNVVPTWTAPVEVTAPVPTEQPVINNVESLNVSNNVAKKSLIHFISIPAIIITMIIFPFIISFINKYICSYWVYKTI